LRCAERVVAVDAIDRFTDEAGGEVFAAVEHADAAGSAVYTATVSAGFNLQPGSSEHVATWEGTPLNVPLPGVNSEDVATLAGDDPGNPAAGGHAVTLNSDGSVTYTPPPGFVGVDWFSYRLTNDQGLAGSYQTIFVDVVKPTVSISAVSPTAVEAGPDGFPQSGWFVVSRGANESPTQALTVAYSVDQSAPDSAVPGSEYAALPGTITIPEGSVSALIKIDPQEIDHVEANKTVTLTVADTAAYNASQNADSATLTIVNTDDAAITIFPASVPLGTTLYTPVTVTNHYGKPVADTFNVTEDDPAYIDPVETTLTSDATTGVAYLPLLANQAGTSPTALVLADDAGNQATSQPASAPSLTTAMGEFRYGMQPYYGGIIGHSKGGLTGTVSFDPNAAAKRSDQVRLIQAIKWTGPGGQNNPLNLPGALITNAGWSIDIDPTKWTAGKGASPYYGDNFFDPDNTDGTGAGSPFTMPATLHDDPGINQGSWTCSIETVAIEADTGQYLGAMTWGFTFTPAHDVSHAVIPLTPVVANTPSTTFAAALAAFHSYYDKKP
jgi:hypothetical protein